MLNFLHTFHPSPILASIGHVHIYWYGLFVALGILCAIAAASYLAKFHGIKRATIIDLSVWLIAGGIVGARLYAVLLELPHFLSNPLDIVKIWQGGLAIHGAMLGGIAAIFIYSKKYKQNFWQLAAVITAVLPLGQAIGRWGNYFNRELFGHPTDLPWGIPIDAANRPWQYLDYAHFHPAFLYESIGNLAIFCALMLMHVWIVKKRRFTAKNYALCVANYAFLYSCLRFFIEFIRVDQTPEMLGLRFPQITSVSIILLSLCYFTRDIWLKIKQNKALDN